jgi:hypothetical protein
MKSRGRTMKKLYSVVLLLAVAVTAACGGGTGLEPDGSGDTQDGGPVSGIAELQAALDDWILGTDFGIESGVIDESTKTVTLKIYGDRYAALSEQDKADMAEAVSGLLLSGPLASAFSDGRMLISVDGQTVDELSWGSGSPAGAPVSTEIVGSVVNLVFIHHSCGENWLNDGLCRALNAAGYHVADIYYGWREYGDRTDTVDWPMWFTDEVMALVYQELGNMTAQNTLAPAPGENTIVMFKSCFPNSDVGSDIADEKAIYDALLPYFEQHPERMFVLVTPPPMQQISAPEKTRELCDWLVDPVDGWLADLPTNNVFVFDLYTVLTHPDAHHRLEDGNEVHTSVEGSDTLYYDSDGDDHPNSEGNAKAAEEFVPLLDHWYREFLDTRG